MRFNKIKPFFDNFPPMGSTRLVKRFALIPKRCKTADGHIVTVWLENYLAVCEWTFLPSQGFLTLKETPASRECNRGVWKDREFYTSEFLQKLKGVIHHEKLMQVI